MTVGVAVGAKSRVTVPSSRTVTVPVAVQAYAVTVSVVSPAGAVSVYRPSVR